MLRRGFQSGQGMVLIPEFIAILLALALYTAAFIAEIVRAGIIAIAKGQTEASYSLGLRPGVTFASDYHPAGFAYHNSATDFSISKFNQKLISCGCYCLS